MMVKLRVWFSPDNPWGPAWGGAFAALLCACVMAVLVVLAILMGAYH